MIHFLLQLVVAEVPVQQVLLVQEMELQMVKQEVLVVLDYKINSVLA